MRVYLFGLVILSLQFCSGQQTNEKKSSNHSNIANATTLIDTSGQTLKQRIKTPSEYKRLSKSNESFASILSLIIGNSLIHLIWK